MKTLTVIIQTALLGVILYLLFPKGPDECLVRAKALTRSKVPFRSAARYYARLAQQKSPGFNEALARIDHLIRDRKYREAVEQLKQIETAYLFDRAPAVRAEIAAAEKRYRETRGNEAKQALEKQDWDRAFRAALDADPADPQIALILGHLFSRRNEVRQPDRAEAERYFTAAAEGGEPRAELAMAKLFESGFLSGYENLEAAEKWYRKAAEHGQQEAALRLGLMLIRSGRPEDAVPFLTAAAREGSADAQKQLGKLYLHGLGVQADFAQAVRWYEPSARNGDLESIMQLAEIFGAPESPLADQTQAVQWLLRAAELGHSTAQYELADRYESGNGTARSPENALRWYRKAAAGGSEAARIRLAEYGRPQRPHRPETESRPEPAVRTPPATPKPAAASPVPDRAKQENLIRAVQAFKNGNWSEAYHYAVNADQENVNVQLILAVLFLRGNGVARDLVRGFDYTRKAAAQKQPFACCLLAACYENGIGTKRNGRMAEINYLAAMRYGYTDAACYLAKMYLDGDVVPKNAEKARDFLLWARQRKSKAAADLLKKHFNE